MKPYSFRGGRHNTGCCPKHDWPVCYRWAGHYKSPASKRADTKYNKIGKRVRRRTDKMTLLDED